MSRIDFASRVVTDTVEVGGVSVSVTPLVTEDAVWVLAGDGTLTRIER